MAASSLPDNPDLDQLRRRARELQRDVRAGVPKALRSARLTSADPAYRLTDAQRLLARRYGFASWPRLHRHVEAINERRWSPREPQAGESAADAWVRAGCLTWSGSDGTLVPPEAASAPADDLAAAVIAADVGAVRAALSADPAASSRPAGVYGWAPLMYLGYGRVDASEADVLAVAHLLLDAGADPNAGRFFAGRPTPFTVLTGVAGGGEGGQPAHPHARALIRVLLDAGADPNDAQLLYNRQFDAADEIIELLLESGLGSGDGGSWRALLPDVAAGPADLVRGLLVWAVAHDQRERVRLLAEHGVDLSSPLPDLGVPVAGGRSPVALALVCGHRDLAQELVALGAPPVTPDDDDALVGALLSADDAALASTDKQQLAALRAAWPGLPAWAASLGRPAAIDALHAAGWDLAALGRGDVPVRQGWQSALHSAVEAGDPAMIRRLRDLGADTTVRDVRFEGTPADWARHLGQQQLLPLLE